MVVINLWWSDKPISNVADFIKWFFLLVRIKSMKVGFFLFITSLQGYEALKIKGTHKIL